MSHEHAALRRVVDDVDRFLHDAFGRVPVHAPGRDADGFGDLLALDDVDHLITSTGLRAPAFRLVRDGVTLPRHEVTRKARIGSQPVDDLIDVAAVHRRFADGATIVLQGLHRSAAPIATFCHDLEATLTHPVQANAYLTPPAAQGLDLHADAHDVFVLQTAGVKRWVVHPADGTQPWDLRLRPGDVLYLPAGTRHAAQTVDEPSLHLTIGVRTVTWRDLARRVVHRALDDPAFGAPLPAGWANEPHELEGRLRDHLAALARRLVDASDAAEILERHATDARDQPPVWLRGAIRDVLEAPALDDATPLRIRGRPGVESDGDRVALRTPDARITMPAMVRPVLQAMLARGRFAPKELDDLIDEHSRVVLCRRLVREGVLTIDREPRSEW